MEKSVLELLAEAMNGTLKESPLWPYNLTQFDRILGPLKSPLVPKLITVMGVLGPKASSPNAAPNVGIGSEAVLSLMKSELVREYGSLLRPNEEIAVRSDGTNWIVIAIHRSALASSVHNMANS